MKINEIKTQRVDEVFGSGPIAQKVARGLGMTGTAQKMQNREAAANYKNSFYQLLDRNIKAGTLTAADTASVSKLVQDFATRSLANYGGVRDASMLKTLSDQFAQEYAKNKNASLPVFNKISALVSTDAALGTRSKSGRGGKAVAPARGTTQTQQTTQPAAQSQTTQPAAQSQTTQPSGLNNFTATLANTVTTPGLASVALGFAVRHALNLGLTSAQIEQSVEQALRNTSKP